MVVDCDTRTALKKAELHYTSDAGRRSDRQWKSISATIEGKSVTALRPPPEANTWFLTITDERDAMVSTVVMLDR